jgi:(4S)-4-hydroxy-5-phosphonooxypentane-2,3-dione isomerase
VTVSRPSPERLLGIFHLHIKEESIDDFLEAARIVLPQSAAEEGLIRYEMLQSREDPGHFTFVDLYRDQRAYDTHLRYEHLRQFAEAIKDLHRVPPTGAFYRVHEIFDRTGGSA